MSPRLPGISAELASAIRAVNVARDRLPEDRRPDVYMEGIEAELDAACGAGDRDRALAAIRSWRAHHLDLTERAK